MAVTPLQSDQIREAFLSFFAERGHLRVPSSSLVPQGDPTLLLTSAGMVQFKPYFTGERAAPSARLTSVQKCFRTTDIDVVGDSKHLTLFEMLGNFSIGGQQGSYFKAEAIAWAWEFSTRVLGLPPERLWATVYLDDDEAWELWRAQGVPAERMRRYGESENFWGPPGDSGPCGPSSEIHYDLGAPCRLGKLDADCGPACPCGRFVELWNLVFTQFHQATDGTRRPLERKNIDTGAGLERLAMVMQGVTTAYDTDIFKPIIARVCQLAGVRYGEDERRDRAIRVVAEHARAATFLIADGIVPSNTGRGYVLRRILRRAVRFGLALGLREPFLGQVAEAVIAKLGPFYPELVKNRDFVQRVIQAEENQAHETLESRLPLIHEIIRKKKEAPADRDTLLRPVGGGEVEVVPLPSGSPSGSQSVIPAQNAFVLHDTYGIPIEVTADVAAEHGFTVDREGFEQMLAAHRKGSRAASASHFGTGAAAAEALQALGLPPTRFVGYEAPSTGLRTGSGQALEHQSTIVALLVGGQPVEAAAEGEQVEAVLMETPFYPEGGGQVGDAGEITCAQGALRVTDTQRPGAGVILHRGTVVKGRLSLGDQVVARVDSGRRADIMRNHTATHLLHAALRQVLGEHVAQAGSLVAPDRLRFDFNHLAPLSTEELGRVEALVNEKVLADLGVHLRETDYAGALAEGALAFFGEKYGDRVRIVEVCELPGPVDAPCERAFSKELCGGTHCAATGQVGLFQIVSESSIGAGVRRLEAVSGRAAYERVRQRADSWEGIARQLRTGPDQVAEKVSALTEDLERERRRALTLERELLKSAMDSLLGKVQELGGVKVVAARVPAGSPEALRQMGDWLRDRLGSGIIVLGAIANDRPHFLAVITPDLVARGFHAGEMLKAVAAVAGGGGGGRPDMAQAGGKDKGKLDEALRLVERLVRDRLAPGH